MLIIIARRHIVDQEVATGECFVDVGINNRRRGRRGPGREGTRLLGTRRLVQLSDRHRRAVLLTPESRPVAMN